MIQKTSARATASPFGGVFLFYRCMLITVALLPLSAFPYVLYSAPAFSQDMNAPAPRMLAGYDPERVTGTVLRLRAGIAADAVGTGFLRSRVELEIDITRVGPNGLDRGAAIDGEDYFVYLISEEATGRVAGLISSSIVYGGVSVPQGYRLGRKLPFGFVYSSGWGGIPAFHVSYWPSRPKIEITEAEDSEVWAAKIGSASEAWADVDFSGLVPDNARIVIARFEVSHHASGVGSAFVRSVTSQTIGRRVGSSVVGGAPHVETFSIRITSDRKLQARATPGTKLRIFVVGYDMTEPS